MAGRLLNLCKTIDKRLWGFENPLRQFPLLTNEILNKLEAKKMTIDRLKEMDPKEIGQASAYWILWNHWDLWGLNVYVFYRYSNDLWNSIFIHYIKKQMNMNL